MEIEQLQEKHLIAIRRFVHSDEFLEIKDAFISHTPERGPEGTREDCDSKNLGKLLGTRYVLNTLEKLAKQKPKQSPDTGGKSTQRGRGGQDPDLES